MDSSWKTYVHRQLGFCVEYPARWVRAAAFDGDGLYFETGFRKFSMPIAEIDVALLRDEAKAGDDYIQTHLAGLEKFEGAEQVQLLESRSLRLRDVAGQLSRNSYFDPQDGRPWVDEVAILEDTVRARVYRLELECRASERERFERVFSRMLNTFQANCAGRSS